MNKLRIVSLIVLLVVVTLTTNVFGAQGFVAVTFAYILGMAFSTRINVSHVYINSSDIREALTDEAADRE